VVATEACTRGAVITPVKQILVHIQPCVAQNPLITTSYHFTITITITSRKTEDNAELIAQQVAW
jgi:hypothetical protein